MLNKQISLRTVLITVGGSKYSIMKHEAVAVAERKEHKQTESKTEKNQQRKTEKIKKSPPMRQTNFRSERLA